MVQSAPQAAPGYDNRYDETGAQYGQSPPSHNPPPIEVVGNAAYGYPPAPPPGYTAQPPSSNPPPTNAAYGYPPPPPPPGYAAPPPGYTAPLGMTTKIPMLPSNMIDNCFHPDCEKVLILLFLTFVL